MVRSREHARLISHWAVKSASKVVVPVIGGHSGVTIIPLLSQSSHGVPKDEATIAALTKRIQFGGDEVVKAKDGAGSATLSMAYAGAEFTGKVVRALSGEKGIVTPSFVNVEALGANTIVSGKVGYFSFPVELGRNGVESVQGVRLSGYEEKLLEAAIPELDGNIQKASGML
jgi:malate dehydrogenase